MSDENEESEMWRAHMKPVDAIQPRWRFDFEKIEQLAEEIKQITAEENN